MIREEPPSAANVIDRRHKYSPVFNRRNERIRGLWERNRVFYAQVKVRGWTGNVRLHAGTVAEAVAARQVLKAEVRSGVFLTPGERGEKEAKENALRVSREVSTKTLADAVAKYQAERDTLAKKDPKTCKREDSGLKNWVKWRPNLPIALDSFDAKLLKDFAVWRKEEAEKQGRTISGRTIDLNVTALANVVRWCVVEKWLTEFPAGWQWDALGEEPDECELLTSEQVDQLCASATSVPELSLLRRGGEPKASLREYVERLDEARRSFGDYLKLLSLTGAREQETLRQRWANVRWHQRKLHFPGGRKGGTKRGAGSRQAAKPREIDFFDKLEVHLKDMYERRSPGCDFLFPNEDGSNHVKSYRKQLERVRLACKLPFVGFHHFRHYFISWCVMKAVDVKTIAHWVGHLDEGLLILQKYGHLAPGHGQAAAKKLDGVWH